MYKQAHSATIRREMAQPQDKQKRSPPGRSESESSPGRLDRIWIALIILGILLRFVVACVSIGTNDAASWLRFGEEINQHGLLATYRIDRDFNHPPIPGYWAALCAKIAGNDETPLHDSIFTITFKLAPIAGDWLAIYLLYRLFRQRASRTRGLFVAAMFSLSINAIAVSGYHCNTDPLLIALCLLCLYLFETRPLLAGLALAAAINIKIIPVLLIPVLLLQLRTRRQAMSFMLGLAAGVIPFVPALLAARQAFVGNALQYNSVLDRWGINFFLLFGQHALDPTRTGGKLALAYYSKARYLILALIGLWALVARFKHRWTIFEAALIPFTIFLIFAPGFGVQYTVLVGLFLFATRPIMAIAYGFLSGLFIAAAYFAFWSGTFPIYSQWSSMLPDPVAWLGAATWLLLVVATAAVIVRPTRAA